MEGTFWDAPTVYSLIRTAVLFALVSWGLHTLKPVWDWEPRWTWVIVAVSVALVGAMCAWRITGPLPTTTPHGLAWWCWWQATAHFVAAGIPVVIWQEATDRFKRVEARDD